MDLFSAEVVVVVVVVANPPNKDDAAAAVAPFTTIMSVFLSLLSLENKLEVVMAAAAADEEEEDDDDDDCNRVFVKCCVWNDGEIIRTAKGGTAKDATSIQNRWIQTIQLINDSIGCFMAGYIYFMHFSIFFTERFLNPKTTETIPPSLYLK
jgi:hypothetical protein